MLTRSHCRGLTFPVSNQCFRFVSSNATSATQSLASITVQLKIPAGTLGTIMLPSTSHPRSVTVIEPVGRRTTHGCNGNFNQVTIAKDSPSHSATRSSGFANCDFLNSFAAISTGNHDQVCTGFKVGVFSSGEELIGVATGDSIVPYSRQIFTTGPQSRSTVTVMYHCQRRSRSRQ
jgi:hypothetical protein